MLQPLALYYKDVLFYIEFDGPRKVHDLLLTADARRCLIKELS